MADQSPSQPEFPPSAYEPAYKYENQFDQPIARSYPDPIHTQYATQAQQHEGQYTPEPQQLDGQAQWVNQPGPPDDSRIAQQPDTKARLRKACDSCSARKVKVAIQTPLKLRSTNYILLSVMKAALLANHVQL